MTAILPGRRTRLAPSVDAGCDAFREAIRATGLEPPQEVVADGVIHRFASDGRRGDAAGWYVLYDDVITYLAQSIEGNVRELEGALNTIMCQSQLLGRTLSVDEVKLIIKNSSRPRKTLAISDVVEKVARYYDIDPASIYEKTRRKEVVKPRQIIMYILREDLQISYPAIGKKLGGRDHTTVIHSCEKIKECLKQGGELEEEISQVRMLLK